MSRSHLPLQYLLPITLDQRALGSVRMRHPNFVRKVTLDCLADLMPNQLAQLVYENTPKKEGEFCEYLQYLPTKIYGFFLCQCHHRLISAYEAIVDLARITRPTKERY